MRAPTRCGHPPLAAGRPAQPDRHQGRPADRTAQGQARSSGDYIGARQIRFTIFPGSALAKKQPNEIMSAELVETSRLFARMNAAIDLGLGGADRRRPRASTATANRTGRRARARSSPTSGSPCTGSRSWPADACSTRGSTPSRRASCSSAHALVDGEWDSSRIDQRVSAFDRANRRAAQAADRGRGAHPAAGHPLRRRGGVRVLRPAHPRRRDARSADSRSGGRRRAAADAGPGSR